ncbi:oxygenase MpaB family protein [Rhodoluna sp.]|uniref:oxygenase MpaB family protein n=1 Tax=Rhodoluna sp. TaxID=1969481 RepID=UPI0025F528E0|nr:oxygenase MpaB family protein [Rhodoluna sp.]
MKNKAWQEALSVRFRRLLSGDPNGVPPWLEVVAAGDDAGWFTPDDAPWVVHADFATLVGGIRALLMQALHPGSLAGVSQHSRYEQDPLGRLSGTIRWLTVTTFGSEQAIMQEASRVNRLHTRVVGDYVSGQGEQKSYRAADADLLLWVHIAFSDSFLTAHEWYSGVSIPKGDNASAADNYVAQWSKSVQPLGLAQAPMTRAELNDQISQFAEQGLLRVDEQTLQVVDFIRKAPLPKSAKPIYALLFDAAVVSLPQEIRQMLGLRARPRWFVQPVVRALLRLMRFAIGPESPIEDAAKQRLIRVGAWSPNS